MNDSYARLHLSCHYLTLHEFWLVFVNRDESRDVADIVTLFTYCKMRAPCRYMVLYRGLIASGRFPDAVAELLYRQNVGLSMQSPLCIWQ